MPQALTGALTAAAVSGSLAKFAAVPGGRLPARRGNKAGVLRNAMASRVEALPAGYCGQR
jgi:hypothetical protein